MRSISILGLLGVAFVVLKLCGVIGWSWWLVTLPFWVAPASVVAGVLLLIVGFIALVFLCFLVEVIKGLGGW